MAGKQDVVTQPAAALIDRDMMGERRQRAQTRLAARGGRPIGCHRSASTNQLRGQYFFNAEAWFAQMPPRCRADAVVLTTIRSRAPCSLDRPYKRRARFRTRSRACVRWRFDPMYQLK